MRYTGVIKTFLLATAVSGCAATLSNIVTDKSPEDMDHLAKTGDLQAEVDLLAKPRVDSGKTPGLIVGVLTADGQMHFYSYGVADKESHAPFTPDTLVPVGSLTKGFVGAVADDLVQQGVLHWDDTLEKLLPDVLMTDESKKITLLELATHTSGMPRQPMVPSLLFRVVRYEFTGDDFYRPYDTSYILGYLDQFDWSPTDHPFYSNTGYALLGYIMEKRTGESLQALVSKTVTGPLALQDTGFDLERLPGHAERARGYAGDEPLFVRRGKPVPDFQLTDMMKSTGGLYSSARDILSFAAACLRDDRSPLSSLLDDTQRVRVPETTGATGIAWFQDQVDGERITYQEGLIGGFSAYVGMDRTHHTAVVVFENSFNWDFTIGHRLLIRMAKAEELAGRAVTTDSRAAMGKDQR